MPCLKARLHSACPHDCAFHIYAAQEVAVLEYQNKQLEENKSLAEKLQDSFDKGYKLAVETIQQFQNMRSFGPPPSASSFVSLASASSQ